jgi:hypothetical protein
LKTVVNSLKRKGLIWFRLLLLLRSSACAI